MGLMDRALEYAQEEYPSTLKEMEEALEEDRATAGGLVEQMERRTLFGLAWGLAMARAYRQPELPERLAAMRGYLRGRMKLEE